MNRIELYHNKPKQFQWKIPFFFLLLSVLIVAGGYLVYQKNEQRSVKIKAAVESPGKKVVVSLPSGQEVFTYEKFIVKKGGKTYYKGERNTIDLTGGKVEYKNW